MEKSNFRSIHVIAKITPYFLSCYELGSYLLCDEMFCKWEKIESWTNCYWHDSEVCQGFFMQDTHSDFVLVDYTPFVTRTAKNEMELPVFELYKSKVFRHNLLFNIYSNYNKKYELNDVFSQNSICSNCHSELWNIEILVSMKCPKQEILDKAWNLRVQKLIAEKCELETAMAWLSTLGGAFSALGDEFVYCAEKAAIISLHQLQIALRLGDPLTVCRCQIYVTMSLLQRGYYKKSKHMIRKLYKFSTDGEGKRDFRLKNMCLAVWNKLKYVKLNNPVNK